MRGADVGLACLVVVLLALVTRDLCALRAAGRGAVQAATIEDLPGPAAATAVDEPATQPAPLGKSAPGLPSSTESQRGEFCPNRVRTASWPAGQVWTSGLVPECGGQVDWLE